jgi:hypothetical protein
MSKGLSLSYGQQDVYMTNNSVRNSSNTNSAQWGLAVLHMPPVSNFPNFSNFSHASNIPYPGGSSAPVYSTTTAGCTRAHGSVVQVPGVTLDPSKAPPLPTYREPVQL